MTLSRRDALHDQSGFTLIELMITVAVVALLAAIAIPSYQDSVWKSRRGEAKSALMRALQAEERYYTQQNTYVAYSGSPPSGSGAFPVFSADNAANSRYTIAAAANASGLCSGATGAAQCIVVTATVNGSADPKCGTWMAIDSQGNKAVAAGTSALDICWGR